MISGFVVMTGDGATSEPFGGLVDAICWANNTNMPYEVIDREKGKSVWSDEDQDQAWNRVPRQVRPDPASLLSL